VSVCFTPPRKKERRARIKRMEGTNGPDPLVEGCCRRLVGHIWGPLEWWCFSLRRKCWATGGRRCSPRKWARWVGKEQLLSCPSDRLDFSEQRPLVPTYAQRLQVWVRPLQALTALSIRFWAGTKNYRPVAFYIRNSTRILLSINTTPPTNIITMVFRLPPLWCRFNESPQSDAWAAIQRVWPRALRRGFI
jgi:hypothetical protein